MLHACRDWRSNSWKIPDDPGIGRHGGTLLPLHAYGCDPKFDSARKRIATIGNGAS